MGIRTDLAMEAKALWEKSAGKTTKLAGVRARERERDGFAVTDVHILDRRGEAALGKPAGRYVTLELPPLARDVRPAAEALAAELRRLLRLQPGQGVLVAGLGNEAVTPDALGPLCLRGLFLTRHLIRHLPEAGQRRCARRAGHNGHGEPRARARGRAPCAPGLRAGR